MSDIIAFPMNNTMKRNVNIRNYFANTPLAKGKYLLLDRVVYDITSVNVDRHGKILYKYCKHGHDPKLERRSMFTRNSNIGSIEYNDPKITIVSNDLELLTKWNNFNDRHLYCYFCKHHNECDYSTGVYDHYICPVCKNETKDY